MGGYILISEDGQIYQSESITEDDENAVGAGILDVVRLSDKKVLFEGDWFDLPVWGQS